MQRTLSLSALAALCLVATILFSLPAHAIGLGVGGGGGVGVGGGGHGGGIGLGTSGSAGINTPNIGVDSNVNSSGRMNSGNDGRDARGSNSDSVGVNGGENTTVDADGRFHARHPHPVPEDRMRDGAHNTDNGHPARVRFNNRDHVSTEGARVSGSTTTTATSPGGTPDIDSRTAIMGH